MTSPVAKITGELEARAATFVREHRLPGAAVGVVHGDDLVWSAGIGFADVVASAGARHVHALPDRVDHEDVHRHGDHCSSATRAACTSTIRVVAYVPELRDAASPFGPIETVTIRRMLSHESGLTSDPPGTDWSTPSYEGLIERNLGRVGEIGTRSRRTRQQKYSNLAYQVLGEVVARVTGVPYVDHVRTAILEPLGMADTHFEPLPDDALPLRATGYNARWLSDELTLADMSITVWAEGGLWSCAEDLARWISFQFGEGSPVLAGSTLKEMHTARYPGQRGMDRGVGHHVVRGLEGRRHMGAALGRPPRVRHERLLRSEGGRRRDRAVERRR